MRCRYCNQPILGGKGDYWHEALGGGYGSLLCFDGRVVRVAQPAEEEEVQVTVRVEEWDNVGIIWPSNGAFLLAVVDENDNLVYDCASKRKAAKLVAEDLADQLGHGPQFKWQTEWSPNDEKISVLYALKP